MSYSRLKAQGKTRPLTPQDVINHALRGHTKMTRAEMTDKVYGALRGCRMLVEAECDPA